MTARKYLLTLTGLLMCGFVTERAAGADFGISFHYGSYAPARYGPRIYTSCYPQRYACYDDDRSYCGPVAYTSYATPRVVVYDDCYPTVYRTTYTRSDCYARPVRHVRTAVRYRGSGWHKRYYRGCDTYRYRYRTPSYRSYYTSPRVGLRVYTGSRCRDGWRSSSWRHSRPPRLRVIRR
jgi:hypothetical protein